MELGRELRYAIRELMSARGYTITAVLTLSCALVANASILGAAFAILKLPDSIERPEELVVAWRRAPERNQPIVEVTYRQFTEWTGSATIRQAAAFGSSHWPMVVDADSAPARLAVTGVSASFFETLGTSPLLGRGFAPPDDTLTSGWVAVVSHRLWRDRFAADPNVIGTTVRLEGKTFTIIGVTPEDFDFPRATDLWTPVVPLLAEVSQRSSVDAFDHVGVLYVLGRIRPGASAEAVRADYQRLTLDDLGNVSGQQRAVVIPLSEHLLGPVRAGLWWLLAAVIVLLAVACANLAALAISRVLARRREQAVRLALGASPATLAGRWVLECLLITLLSVAIGLAVSHIVTSAIARLAPDDIPRLSSIVVDASVVLATIALSAAAMLLWAAAPVVAARSRRVADALYDGARATEGRQTRRFRRLLVAAQICLSVALLLASGLIVRSFVNLQRLDLGFQPDRVLTLNVIPLGSGDHSGAWYQELSERLEIIPGVEAAGTVFLRPLEYGPIGSDDAVLLRGQSETFETALKNPRVNHQVATPGYFRAMRIQLLRGRMFDASDGPSAPRVIVVGETAARTLWPGQDPLGQQLAIALPIPGSRPIWLTVIGVVKDVHYRGIGDVRLDVYESSAQIETPAPRSVVVRASGSPLSTVTLVHAAIREVDSRTIISGTTTMEDVVFRALAPWRLTAWMLGIFAAFTFLLAIVGLVGQLGIDLARRRREFAIRAAIGAAPRDIRTHVLQHAGVTMVIGMGCGVLTALAATRFIDALLFGVSRVDPVTWAAALVASSAALLGTSFVMARRAAADNPASILNAP